MSHGGLNLPLFTLRWNLDELRSVFCDISKRASLKVNFCFFIDGLDEYDGDHLDICSVLQNLANESSHFKFCLSSRPWNVFENVFGVNRLRKSMFTT